MESTKTMWDTERIGDFGMCAHRASHLLAPVGVTVRGTGLSTIGRNRIVPAAAVPFGAFAARVDYAAATVKSIDVAVHRQGAPPV